MSQGYQTLKEPFSGRHQNRRIERDPEGALKAVGFGTATVRAQRYNDDAIPSNWDRSDMITYGKEDPDEVEAMLSRIIPDLQVKYRI